MGRLFMQLVKKFGYPAARKMAARFGIPPRVVNQVRRGPARVDYDLSRAVVPPPPPGIDPRFGTMGRPPLPGVRETGAAQLDRISRAGRTQQTLPPQIGRGPYEGMAVPGRMGEGVPERLSRNARKFFDRRMASPGSVYARPAEMERALKGLSPAQSRRILMALAKMGLIGAGGAGAARMFQDDEGMI